MNNQPLLIIKDCFDLWRSGQGLVILPEVPMKAIPQLKNGILKFSVILQFPDGTSKQVEAQFQFVHFNPSGFKKICSFHDMHKSDLPVGTEIWLKKDIK